LLLILSASGPYAPLRPGLTVVLLDQSPSAREGTAQAVRALSVSGPVRYLAFAERAELIPNPHLRPPLGEATNLKAALKKAKELDPARLLLISDGLFEPAPPPAPLYAYPVEPAPHAEIAGILVPALPAANERVEVRARVFLSQPAPVKLRFEAGDRSTEVVRKLPAGTHSVGFSFVLTGPTTVRVWLESPFGQDQAERTLAPTGPAEVLVLKDPAAARYLRAQGFLVREAERLPETLPRLVVVGASKRSLGPAAPDRLKRHLEEGGGLLFTTTPEGLFFGGWHRAFPDLPLKPKPGQPAAFVLVLDVSGSMQGEKLARAVEGAVAAVEAAREEDLLGIVVYNDRPRWLLGLGAMTPARRRLAKERLWALKAGGGTELAPALAEAGGALREVEAAPKRVLLVTDGATENKDQALLEARKLREAGIGLFVLAVGEDADRAFLKRLAETAQGRYQEADAEALAKAIRQAAEEAFQTNFSKGEFPLTLNDHPVTRGLSPPPVATRLLPAEKKSWARVLMQSETLDVLAVGERGYGRVAALALDLGHDLKDWPDTPRLLAHLARWLLDTPARPRYTLYQDRLYITGRFEGDLWLKAQGEARPIPPVGPMAYEVRVPPDRGDLLVYEGSRLRFRVPNRQSPEWPEVDGRAVLLEVVEGSGGALLAAPRLSNPPREKVALSGPLAILALLALFVELFRRRVN